MNSMLGCFVTLMLLSNGCSGTSFSSTAPVRPAKGNMSADNSKASVTTQTEIDPFANAEPASDGDESKPTSVSTNTNSQTASVANSATNPNREVNATDTKVLVEIRTTHDDIKPLLVGGQVDDTTESSASTNTVSQIAVNTSTGASVANAVAPGAAPAPVPAPIVAPAPAPIVAPAPAPIVAPAPAPAPPPLQSVNLPPTFTQPGPKSVTSGDTLSFVIAASDPEGKTLTFKCQTNCYSNALTVDASGRVNYFARNSAGGTKTVAIRITDPSGAYTDVSFALTVVQSCSSVMVGGSCWYGFTPNSNDWYTKRNLSCDEMCASHGGYDPTTETYAGSGGTNEQCGAVLKALFPPVQGPSGQGECRGGATGCIFQGDEGEDLPASTRCTNSPTTSSAKWPQYVRACACNK